MQKFFVQNLNGVSVVLLVMGVLILWRTHSPAITEAQEIECDTDYGKNRECLTEAIYGESGKSLSDTFDTMFQGTSKTPEIKDIYLMMYKMLKQDPADEALAETAQKYNYSNEEMKAILSGDLSLLAQTQSTGENQHISTVDATQLLIQIKDDYNQAFEEQELKQEMFLDTYPQEIFANGKSSDSGFDVLEDLLIIELLLFGKNEPISPSTGGLDAETADPFAPEGDDDDEPEVTETAPSDEEEETEEPRGIGVLEEDTLDPAACLAEEGVNDAFQDVLGSEESEGEEEEEDSPDSDSDTGTGGLGEPVDLGVVTNNVTAAEAADWTDEVICDSIFCIVVRLTNREDPQYLAQDNCIQCHVQYITQDLLDTAVNKSMNPGKVSGNLMEPAMCKRTLLNGDVSLNFIPVAMPILTPPKGDLIQGVNIRDNFQDFWEDTWGTFGADPDEPEEPSDAAKMYEKRVNSAIRYQLSISGSQKTSTDILAAATEQYEEEIAEIVREFSTSRTRTQFQGGTDFYTTVEYEMDQMLMYFESFREVFNGMIPVGQEVEKSTKKAN